MECMPIPNSYTRCLLIYNTLPKTKIIAPEKYGSILLAPWHWFLEIAQLGLGTSRCVIEGNTLQENFCDSMPNLYFLLVKKYLEPLFSGFIALNPFAIPQPTTFTKTNPNLSNILRLAPQNPATMEGDPTIQLRTSRVRAVNARRCHHRCLSNHLQGVLCFLADGVGHDRSKGARNTARYHHHIHSKTHTEKSAKTGPLMLIREDWESSSTNTCSEGLSHLPTPAIHSLTLHTLSLMLMLKCLPTYFSLWTNWTNKYFEDQ